MATAAFWCTKCDTQYAKWQGRCRECGGWSTVIAATPDAAAIAEAPEAAPLASFATAVHDRLITGITEVDRVLGGGLVPGSVVLIGGEPGVGKSTLLLQMAQSLHARDARVFYLSGEESGAQVSLRAKRLGLACEFAFVHVHDFASVKALLVKEHPSIAIVDSLQTLTDAAVAGEAGSLSQVRAITAQLVAIAKEQSIVLILVGHVTKDGQVAGPKTLEHLVDCVAYLETREDGATRILRAAKNRFGATGEIGVFAMEVQGLIPLQNPGAHFLEHPTALPAGSVITATIDDTRALACKIQSLITKTAYGMPQRRASGVDASRMQLIIALLSRKLKLPLGSQDVFVNAAGGLEVRERASDAAIAVSIISAFQDRALPKYTAILGELGLSGELRPVTHLDLRIKELERMGITDVWLPKQKLPAVKTVGLRTIATLQELALALKP